MSVIGDRAFDVVFSNSVIEHLGIFEDQQSMAAEIRRVGKRYYVQTPNRFFPIEPHFLVPFFQFLPIGLKARMLRRIDLGWYKKVPSLELARKTVQSIRLLSEKDLSKLFPEAHLYRERFCGLVKSFVAYAGWDVERDAD